MQPCTLRWVLRLLRIPSRPSLLSSYFISFIFSLFLPFFTSFLFHLPSSSKHTQLLIGQTTATRRVTTFDDLEPISTLTITMDGLLGNFFDIFDVHLVLTNVMIAVEKTNGKVFISVSAGDENVAEKKVQIEVWAGIALLARFHLKGKDGINIVITGRGEATLNFDEVDVSNFKHQTKSQFFLRFGLLPSPSCPCHHCSLVCSF